MPSSSPGETGRKPAPRLGPGSKLARYEIVERLGAGGMGEVFLARDTHLGREVALKTLLPEYTEDEARLLRFRREARAVAAISHPNIVTLYSDDCVDGVHFLTMEHVQGRTLAASVREGGLDLDRLFGIAIPLADAVSCAHEKGVVHRDLKPGNIMIGEDGRVRVLDFGLAKLREPEADEDARESTTQLLTGEDDRLGTAPYMSPEQAHGRPPDERSDIFALGVILYELASGRRPFVGASRAELISSILRDAPPPLSEVRSDLPNHFVRIVRRCLEKDPDHRYQVAKDLRNDLEDLAGELQEPEGDMRARASGPAMRWAAAGRLAALVLVAVAVVAFVWALGRRPEEAGPEAAAAAPESVRLAVLPAEIALEDDVETADWPGLVQALFSSELTGARDVKVLDPQGLAGIVRGSGLEAAAADRGTLYRRLQSVDVDLVVESTVHAAEDGFQLLGRLVDTGTHEILYSSSVRVLSRRELPAEVRELAESLLSFIQIEVFQLAQDENLRPWISVHQNDIEAVKAFLQATEYIYRYEPGGSRFLMRALEIDPDFVVARLWLISGLVGAGQFETAREHYEHLQGLEGQATPVERAMIDLAGALVADDLPAQAQHLGFILQYSPGNHILLENLAEVQAEMGDCRSAVDTVMPVVEARWSYPLLWQLLGECLIELGELDQARSHLESAVSIGPMLPEVYAMLEGLHLLEGDAEAAREDHRAWVERVRGDPTEPATGVSTALGQISASLLQAGRAGDAVGLMRRAVEYDSRQPRSHELLARALLQAGDLAGAGAAAAAALELDASWPPVHRTLGRIAESAGKAPAAMEHYQTYLKLAQPGDETAEVEQRLASLAGSEKARQAGTEGGHP